MAELLIVRELVEGAVVTNLEVTVVRTGPAEAERERLPLAVRLPKTSKPSPLDEVSFRSPELVLISPRRARVRAVEIERPLGLVLVMEPPRMRLVVNSLFVGFPSIAVSATPVAIRDSFWALLR